MFPPKYRSTKSSFYTRKPEKKTFGFDSGNSTSISLTMLGYRVSNFFILIVWISRSGKVGLHDIFSNKVASVSLKIILKNYDTEQGIQRHVFVTTLILLFHGLDTLENGLIGLYPIGPEIAMFEGKSIWFLFKGRLRWHTPKHPRSCSTIEHSTTNISHL